MTDMSIETFGKMLRGFERKAVGGTGLTLDEARGFARIPETGMFDVLPFTDRVRRHFKGMDVNLCSIVNAKSGLCGEDCAFCSQSVRYSTGIEAYPMMDAGEITASAMRAERSGAREFSIVTSGAALEKERDLSTLKKAIAGIKENSRLETCASLGILKKETLEELKNAGLESYHHNLETSRSFFPEICTTHGYDEDVSTVRAAKALGLYVCSGGIFGLGEGWEDRIALAQTLRELDVDSVPLNFLNPRPGTPLENAKNLSPLECLKIIALFRLMLPEKNIIVCGGREANLRDLQSLIFGCGANGMMVGDYLTTKGRNPEDDLRMIEDLGLRPRR